MNNQFSNIKYIKLTEKEKKESWEFLVRERHQYSARPEQKATSVRHGFTWGHQWQQITVLFRNGANRLVITQKYTMAIFMIVAILLTGGVSIAAQDAMPNDTLYAVKLGTEEVQSWFAISAKKKAELNLEFAERRLEEAERLASRNELKESMAVKLENNFKNRAEKADAHIEILAETDIRAAADLDSDFEASLKAHQDLLTKIRADAKNKIQNKTETLIRKIESERENSSNRRLKAESQIKAQTDVRASAEGKMSATENKLQETVKYLEKADGSIKSEAEAKLKLAESIFAEGKVKLEAHSYNEAFALFSQAHQLAQEVKALIKVHSEVEVEVEAEVEAETEIEIISATPTIEVKIEQDIKTETRGNDKIRIEIP